MLGGRVSLAEKKEKNFSFYLLRRPVPPPSLRQLGRSGEWGRRPRPVIAPYPCFPLSTATVSPRSASPFNFISFRFRPLAHRRLSAPLRRQKEGMEKKFDYPPGKSRLRPLPSLAPFPCRDRWKGKVFFVPFPPTPSNTNTHTPRLGK